MMSRLLDDEVVDAMLPRKASKLQVTRNRTQTDTGGRVENTKALERTGEGTRQTGTVTSGEVRRLG